MVELAAADEYRSARERFPVNVNDIPTGRLSRYRDRTETSCKGTMLSKPVDAAFLRFPPAKEIVWAVVALTTVRRVSIGVCVQETVSFSCFSLRLAALLLSYCNDLAWVSTMSSSDALRYSASGSMLKTRKRG